MINEIGRGVMQGASRRSAIYASLNWQHGDIQEFLKRQGLAFHQGAWHRQDRSRPEERRFQLACPLDMTNISVNYDTSWVLSYMKSGQVGDVFKKNVEQALRTGEPGFSFNFFEKETETLRNACTEVTSSDDSDVCNLGSLNLSRIGSIDEFAAVVELGIKFLLCGTLRAELPYPKVAEVRAKIVDLASASWVSTSGFFSVATDTK